MANFYVYSGAAGTGTGADWTNAKTTLAAAATAAAAGDSIWVAHDHAETQASAMTITFAGTALAPNKVLCALRTGSVPPVSADLRATATVTTTGAFGITITGRAYIRGITFNCGTGASAANFALGASGVSSVLKFDNCALALVNTAAASLINLGAANSFEGLVVFNNTTISFGNTAQQIGLGGSTRFMWLNTASAVLGTVPAALFVSGGRAGSVLCDGVDFSALGSGKALVNVSLGGSDPIDVRFLNCKLGASVAVITGTPPSLGATIVDLLGCDSSTANYRSERYNYAGTQTTETTIVPSSQQASDGTTPITWKVVTSAGAQWTFPFETFPYAEWCDTTGSALTRTFEIVNDGTTLTNAEVWARVEYLGSSATPISSGTSSTTADILTTGTNLTTSTATWTTTGLSSPVKQVVAVTFTPQMKGYFRIVLKVARASQTVYISPRPNEA